MKKILFAMLFTTAALLFLIPSNASACNNGFNGFRGGYNGFRSGFSGYGYNSVSFYQSYVPVAFAIPVVTYAIPQPVALPQPVAVAESVAVAQPIQVVQQYAQVVALQSVAPVYFAEIYFNNFVNGHFYGGNRFYHNGHAGRNAFRGVGRKGR